MKYLNIWHYIKILFKEGTQWEFKDTLNEKSGQSTRLLSWNKRFLLLIPTILICYFLNRGFSSEFIGYTMAALSIFIGLFTNLIIVVYGRYTAISDVNSNTSDLVKLNIVKLKNFIKQFTFVTGKNLLISTYLILLMCIVMLFNDFFTTDLKSYSFINSLSEIDGSSIASFLKVSIIVIFRLQLVYLLIDFFVLLTYSLGALFAFLKQEYNS